MNPLTTNFNGSKIRTITKDGEIWYVAKDVCYVLDLGNPRQAITILDEDQKDDVQMMDSIGRLQQTNIINKSGAYTLALRSRKPEAKKFQRWLTDDVVPSIEKTGGYMSPELLVKLFEQAVSILKLKTPAKTHDDCYLMRDIAGELGMTVRNLYWLLCGYGVFYKDGPKWRLTSSYADKTYFVRGNGGKSYFKVTESGRNWIKEKWRQSQCY